MDSARKTSETSVKNLLLRMYRDGSAKCKRKQCQN